MVARRWVDHDAGLITTLGDATGGVLHQGFPTTPVSNVEMLPSRGSGARVWVVRVKALGDHFSHWVTAVVEFGPGVRPGSSAREFGSGVRLGGWFGFVCTGFVVKRLRFIKGTWPKRGGLADYCLR